MTAPSQADIDAALDVLDWIPLEHIAAMRVAMSASMRAAVTRRSLGIAPEAGAAEWPPVERAMLYILWRTSDEVLESQMPSIH